VPDSILKQETRNPETRNLETRNLETRNQKLIKNACNNINQ